MLLDGYEAKKAIVLSALPARHRQGSGMALLPFRPKERTAIVEALNSQIEAAAGKLKDAGANDNDIVFRAARFRKASRGASN